MKAWLIDELKGIERLRLGDWADPVPKGGEALLQVHFAALNPADRYLAERQYPSKPKLPHILGRDAMGTVRALGSEVKSPRPGERRAVLRGEVGGNQPGTFAELVTVPAENLVEIPDGWSEPEAAGATLVYLTAYQALTMWGPLPKEAVILVTGATGGVGVASVQLASAMGYTVVGLSRSAEKSKKLAELGANHTLNPEDLNWRTTLKERLGARRVDLAVDNIGGKLLPQVIDVLGEMGRVSLVGRLAGPVPEFNTATLFFRRIRMGGVAVGAYSASEGASAWKAVLELLARRNARPLVDSIFPFNELPKAFSRLAEGPMGKVILQVKT
jgi:NADPH2:quinone reductase